MRLSVLFAALLACSAAFSADKAAPARESRKDKGKDFCVVCHGGGEAESRSLKAGDTDQIVSFIIGINRGIDGIERNIKILAEKQSDVTDLKSRLAKARQLFHKIVHDFSREEMEPAGALLKTEITGLEAETISKLSLLQRLDMLYIAAFVFNLAIIAVVLVYALFVYRKRKKSSEN